MPKRRRPPQQVAPFGVRLVKFAEKQLGQKYRWGAENREEGGFDCSGLVDWAMRREGYTGPRVTAWTLATMGKSVEGLQLQPGDLIITNSGKHVVMYAGDGKVIAGSSAQGRVVMQNLDQFRIEDVRRLNDFDAKAEQKVVPAANPVTGPAVSKVAKTTAAPAAEAPQYAQLPTAVVQPQASLGITPEVAYPGQPDLGYQPRRPVADTWQLIANLPFSSPFSQQAWQQAQTVEGADGNY